MKKDQKYPFLKNTITVDLIGPTYSRNGSCSRNGYELYDLVVPRKHPLQRNRNVIKMMNDYYNNYFKNLNAEIMYAVDVETRPIYAIVPKLVFRKWPIPGKIKYFAIYWKKKCGDMVIVAVDKTGEEIKCFETSLEFLKYMSHYTVLMDAVDI